MHFYIQQITRAQEDERKRMARELHDDIAPSLLLIIQRLDAITSSTRPRASDLLKAKLEDLCFQSTNALENLRRFAQDLRPRIIDDLGLVAALEWMAENMTKEYGIDAQVKVAGVQRNLPDELQLLLFRIAQEALSNTRRHAEASKAWITLEFGDDRIVLTIKDNGKGFELPQRMGDLASVVKLGLAGMEERAQLIRGKLTLHSEIGKGTTVTVEAPI
jgi:signal transduction histidine kinase